MNAEVKAGAKLSLGANGRILSDDFRGPAAAGVLKMRPRVIIAEVGFLLILFAGIWFVAAEIPALKASATRRIVAGVALALGGLLLIIATHWGRFG